MKTKYLFAAITGGLLIFTALNSFGANVTWSNNGTNFNTGTNWAGGLPGTGDNAVFTGAASVQPDLSANITIQGLTFSTTASSGYSLTRTGGSLTLTNNGTGVNSAINALNTSGTNTISAPIILGGGNGTTATFTQAAGGTLAISGNISSTNAISGVALDGGNGRIFTLSGNNTYTGTTSTGSSAGITLNLNNANALSTGALVLGVNLSIDNTTASAITLANNNINLSAGSLTFVGTRDLSFGSGTATLSGNNRTITTSAGVLTIGSIDADTTGRTLTKAGAGTLAITGAAGSNFQGGSTLSAGTVLVGNKSSLGSGSILISGGITLSASSDLSGLNAVANAITFTSFTIGGTNNLTLSGAMTQNAGRRITASNTASTVLSGPIFLSNVSGTGYTMELAGAQALTVSGSIADFNGAGTAGGLNISNTNLVTLSSLTSSYTGTTSVTVANGVLAVSKLANGGTNSSIGSSSNATANLSLVNNSTLRYIGSGDSTDRLFTIAGGNNGHGATLDASGSGAVQFTNAGNLAYGTSNQTRVLTLAGTNTGNNSLAFALNNNGNSTLSIVKNGIGTWILSGTNTYNGSQTINDGTLQFAKQVSLYNNNPASWTSANIIVQSGATAAFNVGGTGEFTSSDIDTIKAIGAPTTGFRNGSFIGLDTTNASGGNFTYGTVIANTNAGANSVGLRKLGTNTLTLTGNNTYTGATTVNAGTLVISAGNINSSAVTVAAGAELKYNSGIARTGALTLSGNGTASRATLSGTGSINVALTLDNLGDTLSPGNSPGIQVFGVTQTWNSFTYLWETNNFTGTTAGSDFDRIAITGSLSLTGGTGAYQMDLYSLTAGNVAGNVPNFSEVSRSWTILTTTTGISGFNAANWAILTANFTSSPTSTGSWAISQSGNDLLLNYTAVPEPSTVVLFGLGACFALYGYRRRRR